MKKVKLDPSKITYDGSSFTVVISEDELKKRFKELKKQIAKDLGEEISEDPV